ncbi:MAG: hypothetical protein KOO62_07490 [candidate division Zixibacteria bacterium]|nr:hypothetical protein [candidate division Zixibacteria bacterium]
MDYGQGPEARFWDNGISDERAGYYQKTGLLLQCTDSLTPNHPWAGDGLTARQAGDTVIYRAGVGLMGYFAGPDARIVDKHALSDALLSRLPSHLPKRWRIGHFTRLIPAGYLQTVPGGPNRIDDPDLAKYYDVLSEIISGDLLGGNRLGEIFRFNLGGYDHLLGRYLSRPSVTISYSQLSLPKEEGTVWNSKGCVVLPVTGLRVTYSQPQYAERIELSADCNDEYEVTFYRDTIPLSITRIPPKWIPKRGLSIRHAAIDTLTTSIGYDGLVIKGNGGDGLYSVGHVRTY